MSSIDDHREWRERHQVFELNFHRGTAGDWRYGDQWERARQVLGTRHSLDWQAYRGATLVDIGSGPRSMLEWFEHAEIYCIEPLADEYRKLAKCRLDHPRIRGILAQPAEHRVVGLVGTADLAWSHNCLDHCYDWSAVVANMAAYLKPDGRFYISTDAGKKPATGHPGIASKEELIRLVESCGLRITYRHDRRPGEAPWIRSITLMGERNK
jgi:SAM-dependent methyltransferase